MKIGSILCLLFAFWLLGCDEVTQKTKQQSGVEPSATAVARGITGLEVGMTPQQIGQHFTIKEGQDPVVMLLKKYGRSEEHTSELQSRLHLVCRLLLEKKKKI